MLIPVPQPSAANLMPITNSSHNCEPSPDIDVVVGQPATSDNRCMSQHLHSNRRAARLARMITSYSATPTGRVTFVSHSHQNVLRGVNVPCAARCRLVSSQVA